MRITPQQYAALLIQSIVQIGESKGDDMFGVVPVHMIPENDRKRVQLEMMLLQGFLNDYATTHIFGYGPEREAILGAYYEKLDKLAAEDPAWREFDAKLRVRIDAYAMEVRGQSSFPLLEMPERIGIAFAGFCGDAENIPFSLIGAAEFGISYAGHLKFLGDFKVVL